MTQPTYEPAPQQPPQPQQPQPVPPTKAKMPKRFGWVALAITAFLALGVGGAVFGTTGTTTATPAPTVTRTITETPGVNTAPTEEPTKEPAGYTPKKSDWKITLKILSNKCYDTAGASITYRIKPEFVGTVTPPEDGTIEVSYRVTGGEGGPSDNTFTVTGGQMSYDEEEDVDTPSCSTKLKVKVTDVSYTG